jgi:hypothetical protein
MKRNGVQAHASRARPARKIPRILAACRDYLVIPDTIYRMARRAKRRAALSRAAAVPRPPGKPGKPVRQSSSAESRSTWCSGSAGSCATTAHQHVSPAGLRQPADVGAVRQLGELPLDEFEVRSAAGSIDLAQRERAFVLHTHVMPAECCSTVSYRPAKKSDTSASATSWKVGCLSQMVNGREPCRLIVAVLVRPSVADQILMVIST